MRVLVAMSGGVDSSVAAALLCEQGHEVVGATMKLWSGQSDSGCCSVADVLDARRAADGLGIDHHTFSLTDDFDESVVIPYVAAHAAGRTPNPCVECNRHLKFRRFLDRALRLGFDAIATGHHARVELDSDGVPHLSRGADPRKDQSYVLSVLDRAQLERVILPIGHLQKSEVRAIAAAKGLRTAAKPDSQEVCFIARHGTGAGRRAFLGERLELHRGRVVDADGTELGAIDAIETVTIGQRHGLPTASSGERRYALRVDVEARTVVVGTGDELMTDRWALAERTWVDGELPEGTEVLAQSSAHGKPHRAVLVGDGLDLLAPARAVAPGQLVACYVGDEVVGSGVAVRDGRSLARTARSVDG